MRFLLCALLLTALMLPAFAGDAWAHGGQYRGPGGALPPSLREPHDPKPPPPPPPTTPPTTGTPPPPTTGPTPQPPVTPQPGEPPTPTPITDGLGGTGRPARGGSTITPDSWVFWYEYNKDVLEDLKRHIYKFGDTNPLAGLTAGRAGPSARSAARHRTRALVQSDVIPALLRAMDPKRKLHQDIESAAYIALAKVTSDPAHIELLQKGITSGNVVTRESSVLALGLLRRDLPADRFDAQTLDRVRETLFAVFDDDDQPVRTRAFAALGVGLLGDQPTADGGAARTTDALFDRLRAPHGNLDMPVCVLKAIAMQPTTSLRDTHLDILRTAVMKRRVGSEDLLDVVASYAALALGDVGEPGKDVLTLLRVVGSRRNMGVNVERSSIIALGKLGRRASPEDRVAVARGLKEAIDRKQVKDPTARKFAYIALAYVGEGDVASGRTDVLAQARIGKFLLKEAEDGRYDDRPFGALALGLLCRKIGDTPSIEFLGEFQANARDVLRAGLASGKNDARGRAAFAVALGMAGDDLSLRALAALVGDEKGDDELRGYAAVALGHIGVASKLVLEPIREALVSRRSEKLRRSTATALGLLHDRVAVPLLLDELDRARSQSAKGQAVIALARVGDDRAIPKLIALLEDGREQDLTRALACAGLGIVGDLAWVPSLSRISRDINYRASVDAINEVLSIL